MISIMVLLRFSETESGIGYRKWRDKTMWEIYHKKFSNACIDSYYGKSYKYTVIGVVVDTEENVKAFVQKLNDENHSYWAKEEPSDEFDEDFCDEDNYGYKEFKTTTIEELNWKFGR